MVRKQGDARSISPDDEIGLQDPVVHLRFLEGDLAPVALTADLDAVDLPPERDQRHGEVEAATPVGVGAEPEQRGADDLVLAVVHRDLNALVDVGETVLAGTPVTVAETGTRAINGEKKLTDHGDASDVGPGARRARDLVSAPRQEERSSNRQRHDRPTHAV